VRSDTSRWSISAARSGSRSASDAHRLGLAGHPLRPLQRLRHAVLPGALVQPGQLRRERGQPGGQVVGPQPRGPYGVQRVGGGPQRLPGPLHGGRQPGELGLGLAEQRREPLRVPVQFALDALEFVLGAGQLGAGLRGRPGLQVVPVEVVGVDGGDVPPAGLVDQPAERLEVGDSAPGRGRVVHGPDRLDGDAQVALGGVQLVERGGRRVLRGLRLGPLALGPAAEPAPGAAAGERGGQRERGQYGKGDGEGEGVAHATAGAGRPRRRGLL
jgi:hypothetical protein